MRSRNVRIDNVYVQGTSSHGVETYGVDGLTIGTVTARNTGESGLLLNDTINATVGTRRRRGRRHRHRVRRVPDGQPQRPDRQLATRSNIRVGEVIARGGGRGIFCVSESGGAVIDRIDIAHTGNNAILIENCYNVTIAAQSGTVNGGGDIRIAARTEFPNTADVTLQNLTVTNSRLVESPCAIRTVIRNVTLINSSRNTCV